MSARDYIPPEAPEFLRPPLNQRNGGGSIDTRMHRCSVLPPLTDEQHEHRMRQAELEDDEAAIYWAICDAACSVLLVLTLALLIGGWL